MDKGNRHAILFGKFAAALAFLLAFFISSTPSFSAGFKLRQVNSRNEPELYSENERIILPGTNIKAGTFRYVLDNGDEAAWLGFLTGNGRFYFVKSPQYHFSGDTNIGVYNGHFLIEAPGSASGKGHLMFLVKYNKDSVKLMDVIGGAVGDESGLDFHAASGVSLRDDSKFSWMEDIKDIDGDGNPEIKIVISKASARTDTVFELYLEIKGGMLQVDLNPALYEPLFEHDKKNRSKAKSDAFYIYGFLSGKLKMEGIKAMLKSNKGQYERVAALLEGRNTWNTAFHQSSKDFTLMEYPLK